MQQFERDAGREEQIMDWLGTLADAKNRTVAPKVLATYADMLAPYPTEAVQAAILAIAADTSEFFPPVGRVIAEVKRWLQGAAADTGQAPVLSAEGAWRLARQTIAAYQPQTRPRPASGNPAVDAALRDLGGVAACRWEDAVGEGIARRAFLAAYERHAATPEHLRWALAAGPRETPVVPGLEVPEHELRRLVAEAGAAGVAVAPALARLLDGGPERAAVLDGRPVAAVPALPSGGPEPDPERRRTLSELVQDGIARLAAGMRMGPAPRREFGPGEIAAAEAHLARLRASREEQG